MEAVLSFFKIPFVLSVLWAIALVVATAIVARIASRALRHFLDRDSNPLPSSSIIINIARGVIWATGASIILDACFGVNANALVAALGVGGIAVSLGFQDTLSNLIGGLQVTFMGIVKPGDNIEVGAERGVSPVIDGPRVLFSEISELGIKGKIVFQVEDAGKTGAAADAVVRAIAELL